MVVYTTLDNESDEILTYGSIRALALGTGLNQHLLYRAFDKNKQNHSVVDMEQFRIERHVVSRMPRKS